MRSLDKKRIEVRAMLLFLLLLALIALYFLMRKDMVCQERWVILDDYVYPQIGFNSRLASSDDLVGKELLVYKEKGTSTLEWDGESYILQETNTMDWIQFAQTYIVNSRSDLEKFSFPVKSYLFMNDNAEMTAVTLLVDNNQKVFVRFNDLIGDLAIFPLKRIE